MHAVVAGMSHAVSGSIDRLLSEMEQRVPVGDTSSRQTQRPKELVDLRCFIAGGLLRRTIGASFDKAQYGILFASSANLRRPGAIRTNL